jgi:hypothetical protein
MSEVFIISSLRNSLVVIVKSPGGGLFGYRSAPGPGYISMSAPATTNPAWRTRCREAGIDPAELLMVSSRYRAYRDFMAPRGGGLTLVEWFRFYRLEKQSESPDQQGGVVSGCSATGEAIEQNVLTSPGAFLAILVEQLEIEAPDTHRPA